MCFAFQRISRKIFEKCEISHSLSRANFINIKLIFKILFSINFIEIEFIIFQYTNLHSINIKKVKLNKNDIKL